MTVTRTDRTSQGLGISDPVDAKVNCQASGGIDPDRQRTSIIFSRRESLVAIQTLAAPAWLPPPDLSLAELRQWAVEAARLCARVEWNDSASDAQRGARVYTGHLKKRVAQIPSSPRSHPLTKRIASSLRAQVKPMRSGCAARSEPAHVQKPRRLEGVSGVNLHQAKVGRVADEAQTYSPPTLSVPSGNDGM